MTIFARDMGYQSYQVDQPMVAYQQTVGRIESSETKVHARLVVKEMLDPERRADLRGLASLMRRCLGLISNHQKEVVQMVAHSSCLIRSMYLIRWIQSKLLVLRQETAVLLLMHHRSQIQHRGKEADLETRFPGE